MVDIERDASFRNLMATNIYISLPTFVQFCRLVEGRLEVRCCLDIWIDNMLASFGKHCSDSSCHVPSALQGYSVYRGITTLCVMSIKSLLMSLNYKGGKALAFYQNANIIF